MEVKHKEKRFMVHAGFISKIVNWSLTDTLIWLAWHFKFLKYVAVFFLKNCELSYKIPMSRFSLNFGGSGETGL